MKSRYYARVKKIARVPLLKQAYKLGEVGVWSVALGSASKPLNVKLGIPNRQVDVNGWDQTVPDRTEDLVQLRCSALVELW